MRNAGGGTLAFQAVTSMDDLDVTPASGSLSAGQSAGVRLTYSCRSEGTHGGTVRVAGANRTITVSVTLPNAPDRPMAEIPLRIRTGPQLPADTSVPTPWHMTNVGVELNEMPDEIESFCTTFRIDGEVDSDVDFYFSPFNCRINELPFYGGIQTRIDGLSPDGDFVRRERGAIFSRWDERDTDATMTAGGGLYQSLGNEGDFISVRNGFRWSEGRYRLCLRKADTIEGDPLPENYTRKDIGFSWGTYAHTWIRMEVTNLASDETTFVGALAFPGDSLVLRDYNILFAEIYGSPNPFRADRVPQITIAVENFQVNGETLPYRRIGALSNTIPGEETEPKMTRIRFDTETRVFRMELGEFVGRFGIVRTYVFPSAPAIESIGLVTANGERYAAALWDGRESEGERTPARPLQRPGISGGCRRSGQRAAGIKGRGRIVPRDQ